MAPVGSEGSARVVSSALRRGVRLELLVAPISFALPVGIGLVFADLGARHGQAGYVALGLVLIVTNVAFSLMMVRNAVRFLRGTRPTVARKS